MDQLSVDHGVSHTIFDDTEWDELRSLLSLTERQSDVMKEVFNGQTDQQIAAKLEIASPTVRFHLQGLFRALGVSDRTNLVIAIFKVFRNNSPSNR